MFISELGFPENSILNCIFIFEVRGFLFLIDWLVRIRILWVRDLPGPWVKEMYCSGNEDFREMYDSIGNELLCFK